MNTTLFKVVNSTLTIQVGPSTVAVGSNAALEATRLFIGNSTVNAVMNTSTLSLANSTANARFVLPTAAQVANNNYYWNANGSWVQVSLAGIAYLDVADQVVTGGARITSLSLGVVNSGTLTPDPGDRPMQHYTANGAHTLAPGSNAGSYLLDILNGASAATITTSGWTKVDGDAFTTTNGHKFRCSCTIGNNGSVLVVQAMQ
jgi:hypothetical protein